MTEAESKEPKGGFRVGRSGLDPGIEKSVGT